MGLELNPSEQLGDGIRRILLERIEASLNLLTNPGEDLDGAVHEVRKNCKRIRAVLRLVRDEIGKEAYRRENVTIRDVSRTLAPMRDSWVMVETLDHVKNHYQEGLADNAFESIRAELMAQYELNREKFMSDSTILPAAIAEFEAARERIAALPLSQDEFSAVVPGLRRVYKRGYKGLKKAYQQNAPEIFHEWRKRIKYLWHQFEVLHIMWPSYMGAAADELHKLSKHLGEAHDLVVLTETLESQPELFAGEAELSALLSLLAQRQAEKELAARPLGERMYAEAPEAFVKRLAVYWRVWGQYQFNGLTPAESTVPADSFVSTREAAETLGVSVKEVRERIRDGQLTAVKVGSVWVISQSEL